jgi:hypothetical protein
MMSMKSIQLLLLVALVVTGCSKEKEEKPTKADSVSVAAIAFDTTLWAIRQGENYPHRDRMLGDLINNRKLRGLNRSEIKAILGEPDRTDSTYLFYRITQKRIGFLPVHTKTMVIKLAADSTTQWVKIHE